MAALKTRSARRARQISAPGHFTENDLLRKLKMCGGVCSCCGINLKELPVEGVHLDHEIPLSCGGSNWPANLTFSRGVCNQSKGAKTLTEFAEYRQSIHLVA